MKGRSILLLATVLLAVYAGKAQYVPVTSQYLFNGLVINPAYAGSQDVLSMSLSHRTQWVGLKGAPNTQNFSFHGPLKNESIALGAMFFRDAIGVTNENALHAYYAYRIRMKNDGFFSMGVSGGVSLFSSDWDELAVKDPNDPQFAGPSPVFIKPNIGFGTYFYNKHFFGGLSVPFLLSHKLTMAGNRYQVYNDYKNYNVLLQLGMFLNVSKSLVLKPSVLCKRGPANSYQVDGTLQAILDKKYSLGVSYRTANAMVFLAQMKINDQWFMGYSFDYSLSGIKNYQYGSHEVLLRYLFYYRVNARSPRYF